MLRNTAILIGIILGCCCSSCQREETDILARAENMMEQQPDKALKLLENLQGKKLSAAGEARYALLYTEALDKNAHPAQSDSLIRIALNHYRKKKPSLSLAKSYFYLGSYFLETGMIQEATENLCEAERIALPLEAWNLLGLISGRLAYIYDHQRDWEHTQKRNKLAEMYFKKAGNKKNENLSYYDQALYFSLDPSSIDSTLYYIQKAKQGFEALKDTSNLINTLIQETSIRHFDKKEAQSPQQLLQKIKILSGSSTVPEAYLLAADIYYRLGQADSARIYLDSLAKFHPTSGMYALRSQLEEEEGNYRKALAAYKKMYALEDSLFSHITENFAYRYAQIYNRQREAETQQKLLYRNRFMTIALFTSVILALLFYFIYRNRWNERNLEITSARLRIIELEKMEEKFKQAQPATSLASRSSVLAFFQRQIEMVKELAEANRQYIHKPETLRKTTENIRKNYSLGEQWEDLKTGIDALHHHIVTHLEKNYGELLTENEIKVCLLTVIGFNVQETALFLNISEKTVYNLRSSVAKKISSDRNLSLEQILENTEKNLRASAFNPPGNDRGK